MQQTDFVREGEDENDREEGRMNEAFRCRSEAQIRNRKEKEGESMSSPKTRYKLS